MALPSNVGFCTVKGRFIRAIMDGSDDPDRDPDGIPIEGLKAVFTAGPPIVRNVTAVPPVMIVMDPITATTNEDGVLIGPDGQERILIVGSDDPDLDPTGWTYSVRLSGPNFPSVNFSFVAPVGEVIDLSTVIPVPANPGTGLVPWQEAVAATLANVEAAQIGAEAAELSAVAAREAADSVPTEAELSATIAGVIAPVLPKKQIFGGNVPKPVRAPTLTMEDSFPNGTSPFEVILWVENSGATMYSLGKDATLRKTTDSGATWAKIRYWSAGVANTNCFLKTATGALLLIDGGLAIQRSTDDGVTWASVKTARANTLPLGTQSWCIDKATGYIYFGEYNSVATADVVLWRSTDDGATWSAFHTFPGWSTADPERITHIHAVQWDHVAQRVVISTGDSTDATGLYRVNAPGTDIEAIVTNRMLPADQFNAARTIGIIPFPDYIAWASDSTDNPWLFRMARTEIGKPFPVVERIYRLNSTAWWSCRASTDGTRWVISASPENAGTRIDNLVHLYAVEDQGATIYEVATIAPVGGTVSAGASLMPVGLPENYGEHFFMTTRQLGKSAVWKFRLGYGGTSIAWPRTTQAEPAYITESSGSVTVASGASVVFGVARVPVFAKKLRIFDAGASVQAGTPADIKLDIRKKGSAFMQRVSGPQSLRTLGREELGGPVSSYTMTGNDEIEFVITNTGVGSITGTGFVTYGFAAG